MPKRSAFLVAASIGALIAWQGAKAGAGGPCNDSLSQRIPARPADAPSGRAFAESLRGMTDDERELSVRRELAQGNIPAFLRRLVPIRLESPVSQGEALDVIICAAPDYLAIGSDDDFLLIPMRLATALSTALELGFTIPTPHIVDVIYRQARVHFAPQPLPAGSAMRSTGYLLHHNELVAEQRAALGVSLGTLSAGDKKDLVLTNRLRSHLDRVAIYGWHASNGRPIQPLSTVHGWRYADYSHGTRLISTQIFVNGRPQSIFTALQDTRLAWVLSDEGILRDAMGLIETLDGRAQAVVAAIR